MEKEHLATGILNRKCACRLYSSANVTLGGKTKDVVATIRETTSGTFHYDLSRDISDGARFSRMDSSVSAGSNGVSPKVTSALEGNPVELNIDFAGAESQTEAVLLGTL